MNSPNFSVRFYVRTTKAQGGDSPTPLRAKVWIGGLKKHLYLSTKVTTTKRKWADFSSDGTPSPGADPELMKAVDSYKAATQIVMAGAVVNNRTETLTSEQLSRRVDAIVTCMKKPQRITYPILAFTSPRNVPTCADCIFRNDTCTAKWPTEDDAAIASDMALYQRKCTMFKITPTTNENFFSRYMINALIVKSQNPEMTMEEACKVVQDDLLAAMKKSREERDKDKEVDNGSNE